MEAELLCRVCQPCDEVSEDEMDENEAAGNSDSGLDKIDLCM